MDLSSNIQQLFGPRKLRDPPGFVSGATSPDDDDIDVSPATVFDAGPLSTVRLALHYEDSKGDRSHRVIQVKCVQVRGDTCYLCGFCELRNRYREFRLDRIVEIVDMRTGEVAEDPHAYLAPLLDLARPARARKVRHATDGLLAESVNGLVVLLYFANSDGELNPAERRILWEYLDWQKERCSIKGRVARPAVDALMRTMFPTGDQFAEALEEMVMAEHIHAERVLGLVPAIIDADGQLDEEEVHRWQQLRELLAEHGIE
jgi:tellurite resistance protein/NAD-dependent dihydropyrimidine dehydrogenase PreA subunit